MQRRKRLKKKGLVKEWNPNLDAVKSFFIAGALSASGIWGAVKFGLDDKVKENPVQEERVDIGGGISVRKPAPIIDPGPEFEPVPEPVPEPPPSSTPSLSPGPIVPVEEVKGTTPGVKGSEAPKGKAKAKGKPVFKD